MKIPSSSGQGARSQLGFTMLELVVVLAIAGILAALAVPGLVAYQSKEQTRSHTQQVAGALREARSMAIRRGRQYFALFNPPAPAPAGTLVRIVEDVDGDWQVTAVDRTRDYGPPASTDADVTVYGPGGGPSPFPNGSLVPGDPTAGLLAGVVDGANFPPDPNTGLPAVGFTPQGVPVNLASPTAWGSGSGAFYMTDGRRSVYAAVLFPLGEVRVRSYDAATDTWR